MIPKECKRLAEVDFPIAVVSKHSASDKYIRHKPTTLHTWWAQRPLAACRAVLLGLLLPDPCNPLCPKDFKERARELLPRVQGIVGPTDEDLGRALLKYIGDFSAWEMSANPIYLEVGRGLVKAAYPEGTPLVVDPFAGGGSIPLEALRLGCEAFASDLNPVACLILKVLLKDIPGHGPALAADLRRVGAEIKEAGEKELAEFYPADPDGARPIAYLWARTIRCEAPNCGAEIHLVRSFWLCKKDSRRRALRYKVIHPKPGTPRVDFEIFEPASEREVPPGTVSRAKATCLCCNTVASPERVRAQLAAQRGGADVLFDDRGRRVGGARLLAVITLKPGEQGRCYRLPAERDYEAVWGAMTQLAKTAGERLPNGLSPVPDEPLPPIGTLGFRVQRYGMLQWGDLFSARQKLTLSTISRIVHRSKALEGKHVLRELLAFVMNKFARHCNGNARWNNIVESVEPAFGAQTLPITWTFPESIPWGPWAENYDGSLDAVVKCLFQGFGGVVCTAQVQLEDAVKSPLPDATSDVWFTDPPYYDAVPYADLSDFFFVWLRRMLRGHPLLRDPFDPNNPLTPKAAEIVQDETKEVDGRPKDRAFFEETMAQAFSEGRRVLKDEGIGCVVFAHKTTEGWEALLTGVISGGWVITGSWPIATERAGRLRARESAALAASIHLVCRPRPDDARVGDWAEVLQELPRRVGDWMERLQGEGIRGADLVFACIGPALEVFSRYKRVESAEGREVSLSEYLEKVWEVVGRTALEQVLGTVEARARNSAAGALEEDARLTALFLWTLQSTNGSGAGDTGKEPEDDEAAEADEEDDGPRRKKGYTLIYDVVRRFAQPLGIHLDAWKGRIIEIEKGVVRLLPVTERAEQFFGKEGVRGIAERFERTPVDMPQLVLFPSETEKAVRGRSGRSKKVSEGRTEAPKAPREPTTLDRVHIAMLLQASGQANALRGLLRAEQDRGPDFLRLANALSALYPRGSEEKRLLDAMLLAIPSR